MKRKSIKEKAAIDWTSIYKKYKGQWVALKKSDEKTVIASAKTLKEAAKKTKDRKDDYIFTRVPEKVIAQVGCPLLHSPTKRSQN